MKISYQELYDGLEKLKFENPNISDYIVNQQSLDQVFNQLASLVSIESIEESVFHRILMQIINFLSKK